MFGNKAAGAGLPPARGRPGARSPGGGRAGRAGAAGRGAGAPARPGRAGGADGGGQLTVTPGRPGLPGCSPPRPARGALPASPASPGSCCPGAPRTLGVRGESGQAAAAAPGPGACGLGSGRPLRRGGERVVEEEGFKGEARPGGRWEGRASAQPSGKVAFVLSYFFSSSFPGVLFVSCERRPCIAVESGPGDGKSGVEEFVRDLQCKRVGAHQVERQARIVSFSQRNGPFLRLTPFFLSVRGSPQINTKPPQLLSVSHSLSQHLRCLRVLAIFMKAFLLLVHGYCMYVEWFRAGFHFSASFIPEDFIWS